MRRQGPTFHYVCLILD